MISISSPYSGIIKLWRRSDSGRNRMVKYNEKVACITLVANGVEIADEFIHAPCSGKLLKILMNAGDVVEIGDTVAEIEPCRHPALFNSLCVSCGDAVVADRRSTSSNAINSYSNPQQALPITSVPFTMASGMQLQLSTMEAERLQYAKKAALLESKKLALVLDLDHTLLHAAPVPCLPSETTLTTLGVEVLTILDNGGDPLMVGANSAMPRHHLIKLRPGITQFLEEANSLYQLFIYTAGTRKYAEGVADLLDPAGKYFQRRIVSRSDSPNDPSGGLEKSLRKILPGDSSQMAVILDDREDVWRGQGHQLLLVKPFEFFRGVGEVNNSSGQKTLGLPSAEAQLAMDVPVISLVNCGQIKRLDVKEAGKYREGGAGLPNGMHCLAYASMDDQLQRSMIALRSIHSHYYNAHNSISPSMSNKLSVGDILTNMKSSVLRGCRVAFSGMIPLSEQHPENFHCWKLAAGLGAEVSVEVTPATTHLISLNFTNKVAECVERGNTWVLHPDWLVYCRWSLCKCLEQTFMVVTWPNGKPFLNPALGCLEGNASTEDSQKRDIAAGSTADEQNGGERKRIRLEEPKTPPAQTNASPADFNGLEQLRGESEVAIDLVQFIDLEENSEDDVPVAAGTVVVSPVCADSSDEMDDTGNEVVLTPTLSCSSFSGNENDQVHGDIEDSCDDENDDDIQSVDEDISDDDSDSECSSGSNSSCSDSEDSFASFDEALLNR